MGCSSSTSSATSLVALAKQYPIKLPPIPGDILLLGELPKPAVEAIASQVKGWLYLNPASDPNFFPDVIGGAGADLQLLPFNPQGVLQARSVDVLVDAINRLRRPLVMQCSNRCRASAVFLLWLADKYGYRRACIDQLVSDLDLDVQYETKQWLECQLPAVGSPEPLTARSPEVKQLFEPEQSSFVYVVHCSDSKEAIVIDPMLETYKSCLKLIQDAGLQLKYVAFTDHSENSDVHVAEGFRQVFPKMQLILPEGSDGADLYCKHGDSFALGQLFLEVRSTPGYTRYSVSYVLKTPTARFAFTGYALLVRGCGRRISGVGDRQIQRLHFHSVQEQLLSLEPETIICPRFDVQQRNVSTVAEERKFNPRFKGGENDFIRTLESGNHVRNSRISTRSGALRSSVRSDMPSKLQMSELL